jgi:hypothetical protein
MSWQARTQSENEKRKIRWTVLMMLAAAARVSPLTPSAWRVQVDGDLYSIAAMTPGIPEFGAPDARTVAWLATECATLMTYRYDVSPDLEGGVMCSESVVGVSTGCQPHIVGFTQAGGRVLDLTAPLSTVTAGELTATIDGTSGSSTCSKPRTKKV